jgi:hypothetical protein
VQTGTVNGEVLMPIQILRLQYGYPAACAYCAGKIQNTALSIATSAQRTCIYGFPAARQWAMNPSPDSIELDAHSAQSAFGKF